MVLAEAIGDQNLLVLHRYNLSCILWCSGYRDQALAVGERALMELRKSGYHLARLAACLTYLGIILEDAGDWTTALAYLEEARSISESIGSNPPRNRNAGRGSALPAGTGPP